MYRGQRVLTVGFVFSGLCALATAFLFGRGLSFLAEVALVFGTIVIAMIVFVIIATLLGY